MSALSLRLPASLHRRLGEVAEKEGVSINQLVNSAVAEKMAALLTEEYLAERGRRGSRRRFAAALAKVPGVEPEAHDRLEERPSRVRRVNPPIKRTGHIGRSSPGRS